MEVSSQPLDINSAFNAAAGVRARTGCGDLFRRESHGAFTPLP